MSVPQQGGRVRAFFEYLRQDIHYAARQLARAPLFTSVSAFSLGVGIAVAVTVYSLINSVLFKALPVEDPSRLLTVFTSSKDGDFLYGHSSYSDVADYQATGLFSAIAAEHFSPTRMSANNFAPEWTHVAYVSPNYFDVVGLKMKAGRTFSGNSGLPEIIISERYSRRIFERGAKVVGATIRVKDMPFTVIGVVPGEFRGTDGFSSIVAWLPYSAYPNHGPAQWADGQRGDRIWAIAARLAPGVTQQAAATRMNVLAHTLAQRFPKAWQDYTKLPYRVTIVNPRERILNMFGKDLPLIIATFGSLIGVVLILACTNVAGLLLARSVTRRHEIAVRLTMGASRKRLVTQLLTESMLLAMVGGGAGVFIAYAAMKLAGTTPLLDSFNLAIDWRVLLATLATCIVCAITFGLTPALQTLRVDVKAGLSGHSLIGDRGGVRSRLMALQVALAFLLIVLGFSASRGIQSEMNISTGFDVNGLLIVENHAETADSAADRAYVQTELDFLRGISGVTHAIRAARVPAGDRGYAAVSIVTPRGPLVSGFETVDEDYFATVGMRLLAGRLPRRGERAGARPVALVDRTVVDWFGHSVLGGTLVLSNGHEVVVIGVVDGVRRRAADNQVQPYVYEMRTGPPPAYSGGYIISRMKPGTEREVSGEFIRLMRARYTSSVPPGVLTMRSYLESALAPQRFIARIGSWVGIIQLALAAVGLYSLLLYATLTRTREIGLRMALGAPSARASFTVMKEGLVYVLGGAGLGILLGIPAAFYSARIFIGTQASDPVPFVVAVGGIAVATVAASCVPARKAARVQPMEALRHE